MVKFGVFPIYKVAAADTECLLVEIYVKPTEKGRSISYYSKVAAIGAHNDLVIILIEV